MMNNETKNIYIKTIDGLTCMLKGTEIKKDGDWITVYDGDCIIGLFDVGSVSFTYATVAKAVMK